jgi:TatA/E family protein of Tat protein translocase
MLGPQDVWVALALGVFFFGAKKLPELSRSLGQAMTEFKKGLSTGDPERPVATAPPAAVVSTVAADPAADHATTDGAQKP